MSLTHSEWKALEYLKSNLLINLENFLLTCEKRTEKVIIILDEAQNLSVDVLEEVRLLTNFEHHGQKLLQIILVGQPQLEYVLQLPQLTQLTQRIGFNCQLLPLNYSETKWLYRKKVGCCGVLCILSSQQRAIKQIFMYSKGIPRVINLISDTALLFGFGDEKRTIGRTIIRQVMQELNLYSSGKIHAPCYHPQARRTWASCQRHHSASRHATIRMLRPIPWPRRHGAG